MRIPSKFKIGTRVCLTERALEQLCTNDTSTAIIINITIIRNTTPLITLATPIKGIIYIDEGWLQRAKPKLSLKHIYNK